MNFKLVIAVIHTTGAVVKLKPEKNSGLNRIQTHIFIGILHFLRVYYKLTM